MHKKIELEKIMLAQLEKQLQLETLRSQNHNSTEFPSKNDNSTAKSTNDLEKHLCSDYAGPK